MFTARPELPSLLLSSLKFVSPFCRMIIGTVVFQLLMLGVIGLKESYAASILLLPLPVITVLFYLFILQHYIRPAENLSLSTAHGLEDPAPNFVQVRFVGICQASGRTYRQTDRLTQVRREMN